MDIGARMMLRERRIADLVKIVGLKGKLMGSIGCRSGL